MKASELKEKSVEELQEDLLKIRREQLNQRLQRATGQLEKTHEMRSLRRDVARIKTVLNQKIGK